MQKLIDTLKSFGIEIPEDKQADVKKALSEHYKNAKEVAKTLLKVEGERDDWKVRAETAEETLKGFDGIDPANIQTELAGWKKKPRMQKKNSTQRSMTVISQMHSKQHLMMLNFPVRLQKVSHGRHQRSWIKAEIW